MAFFTSCNLCHVYVYGNHQNYLTVFRKLLKFLKTVSYAFLDFWIFSKNLWKSSEVCFLSNFASFENFLKMNLLWAEYAFWQTLCQPIRMQEIAMLYNKKIYWHTKNYSRICTFINIPVKKFSYFLSAIILKEYNKYLEHLIFNKNAFKLLTMHI